MTEFRQMLHNHGLGLVHFGKLIGSSRNSVIRYERGDEALSEKIKRKIEIGIRVLTKYDIVCPTLEGYEFYHSWYNGVYDLHDRQVAKYDKLFKELFAKEAELT